MTLDIPEQTRRLEALRAELARRELAYYLVPKLDEYMLAYTPPASERLAWLTGFTGSAGLAVIGREKAAFFVDGRYTTQVRRQTPEALWEYLHIGQDPPSAWLARTVQAGDRVGYDPRVHTSVSVKGLRAAVERAGGTLVAVDENLVDVLWTDRPAAPAGPVELYPEAFAGESAASKRARMAAELQKENLRALIISAPENLAWLANVRGSDVPNTPLALGRAILDVESGLTLYLDPARFPREVLDYFASERGGGIRVEPPERFPAALEALSSARVRVDQTTASDWLVRTLSAAGAQVDLGADPCALAKACKTPAELAAMRAAHVRDGVAVVRFLAWLERTAPGGLDEWSAAEKLAEFRAPGENYRGPSFDTISAFGPSSALPHYRATREEALPLATGNLYLVDSGGQYLDGTTDITRVTCIGDPTDEMKRRYTQVLKGHVALARAKFPAGTSGSQLDVLARQFLWQDGVDFDHGTGHGVGCYLSVHEGPQNISTRPNDVALRPGMVVSNEPGYYKPGHFGIRIENLIAVIELDPQPKGAEKRMLGFETLTLVPYERRLIDVGLLTSAEALWIDAYHARVRDRLMPEVGPEAAEYLARATAPLAR